MTETRSLHPHRSAWLAASLALFCVEVLIATIWAHVPFVRTEFGDYLVVILLYAIAKSWRPFRAVPLALAILAFSFAVEAAQAFSIADRMGFARGGVGSIVVGTSAQWPDLAMYAAGCLTAWLVDAPGRRPKG